MEKEKTITERILEKALEICLLVERDEVMTGNAFVEIGERSIALIGADEVTFEQKGKTIIWKKKV